MVEEEGTAEPCSSMPPLFEMHFEMNPRDPEYDAKVYLAIDQVKITYNFIFAQMALFCESTSTRCEEICCIVDC